MGEHKYKTEYAGADCECGCKFESHQGLGQCTTPDCLCQQFHQVGAVRHEHECEACGRVYSCSHSRCRVADEPTTPGICNICAKKINDNYPGDLMAFLFGVTTDHPIDLLRAKRLAMAIRADRISVRDLWRIYQEQFKTKCSMK